MYQNLVIVGRLGKQPDSRYTASGRAVTTFSVATNRQYTGSEGNPVKETIWFRVTTWGKLAELCNESLDRGSLVLVEGRLTADEHGNPKTWKRSDGSVSGSFEVTANSVRFLSGRSRTYGDASEDAANDVAGEDEIPF